MKCTVPDQELFTKGISTKTESSKLGALKCGQTAENMRASGQMGLQTERVDSGMRTGTPTKGCGCMIRRTDTDFTSTQTGPVIWVPGRTTCKTEKAKKHGRMALVLKAITSTARSTGRESTTGPMAQALMGAGATTK